jgi:hypothetical protein
VLAAERLRAAQRGVLAQNAETGMKVLFLIAVAGTAATAGFAAAHW